MNKEIKEIITTDGKKICRITCPSERWYAKSVIDSRTGLPTYIFLPSVTWIKSFWYLSPYLVKWIVEKGFTEAETIKKEAGLKGDKIHQATEDIDKGIEISIDSKYLNKEKDELEELTAEEIEGIISYRDYIDKEQPELIASEMTVFSEGGSEEYAGTLDRIWANGFVKEKVRQIWIVDIKSSSSVYKDMIIQLSAYSHSDIDYQKLGITEEEWQNKRLLILQIGYSRNSNKYKATEVSDRYDLFKIAYQIWKEENPEAKPKQRDFPLLIQSKFRKEQLKVEEKVAIKEINNKKKK